MNQATVTIVGGGLAGSEAALQLADRGVQVRLYEMRPHTETGAHKTEHLGEIVCSNSFKSLLPDTASGVLKAEMEVLGCRLLQFAHQARVPAGHALAIDRDIFSGLVTEAIASHPNIEVIRERVDSLSLPLPALIATGPLTGSQLSADLQAHCSSDHLFFYDAIAPSIDGDTVDESIGFWASRYGKGDADYLNIPLDRERYQWLIEFVLNADYVDSHAFEEADYFESCLPIEVMAARGPETMRFGPLKPKGLVDPRTGREPHAVLQLRQESRHGNLLGLVGFQTRMKWPQQKELINGLPGLEKAKLLRYGTIHRNMFLNSPEVCDRYLRDRKRKGLFYAGQICGVEGYVESIMSAMIAALEIYSDLSGDELAPIPANTMIGALMDFVHTPVKRFQPMNANMGIVAYGGPRGRRNRKARNEAIARDAVTAMEAYRQRHPHLFADSAAA